MQTNAGSGVSAPVTSQEPDPSFSLTPSADVAAPQLFAAAQLDPDQALRLLADHTREVVCLQDVVGRISWISPAVQSQLGFPPQALLGSLLEELIDPADHPAWRGLMADAAAAGPASTSLRMLSAEGESRWMALTLRPAKPDDPAAALVSRWHDIGAEVELRHQLEQALGTDPLSGLAHWRVLIARLKERVARPDAAAGPLVLFSIGIDRLSQVNDALTHRAGDRLIATIAARLSTIVEASDLVARGTGDTFLVLLGTCAGLAEAGALAERLRLACKGPITYAGQVLEPTVSIGLVIAEPGQKADELLRDASLAMRQAASQGRDRCVVAQPQAFDEPRRALALQAEIRAALEADELKAWFMPVMDLASGVLCGYEALVRWVRPDGSVVMPDDCLPTARRSTLAVEIDLRVLRLSIAALASLPADRFVAANVTPATLGHPDLAAQVDRWLQEAGVAPNRLQLEITETDLLHLAPGVREPIDRLAALGVRWWIDDFGTGFSSISHLRDLPIHGIKLDRSFTASIGDGDLKSVRLAQALAGLAEGLGLATVAEGVESVAEAAALLEFGWQKAQGWLYGKAAPLQVGADPPPLPAPPSRSGAAPEAAAPLSRQSWALAVTDNVPVGLYALRITADGEIQFLFVSRRWLEMLQLIREAVLADAALVFERIHPEDAEAYKRRWQASTSSSERLLWEGRLLVEGVTSWVRIEGISQRQADGSSIWQGVMSDITEPKQRELDLQRSLDHAPIAIVALALTDPDPEITYVNRAFRRTFGYDRSAIPRRSDWIRLSFPDPAYREALVAAWQTELEGLNGEEDLVINQELTVCTADGRRLDVLGNWVVHDDVLLVSLLDISERRQAERDLHQARSALAESALAITEAIPVGTFTIVLPPDGGMASFSFVSERFLEITGLEREAAAADPFNAFACVHPDDYDAWVRRNAEVFAAKLPFYGETRIVVRGEERWISAESVPRHLPDGSTVWEGVLIDITDRIKAQEELHQEKERLLELAENLAASEERYRLLAENSSDVVMQLGNDGVIRWVSPSLTAMLGWQQAEWIGRPGREFLEHRGDTETHQANLEALQAGRSVVARDRIRSRSGTWHWVETHACPFRTANGAIDGLVAFFRTIDAEVEAEAALARQASTDALTGLPNRRETFRQLEELTRSCGADLPPLALAFCDLDWFKRVNDSHGHAAGDALLVAVGERLRTALRPDDLVGRIGGDELLVVLVGVTDLKEALERAEGLRAAVREPLPIANVSLDLTVSIGVTLFQPGESVDALVARADAAMYRAKQAGRDRVIPISA
jgi:diguanylate cyclase (GGDEF)-like protein/PAS domain S-box-containing protein